METIPNDPAPQTAYDAARDRLQRLRDIYALLHLIADFIAGLTFTIGSVLFFWPSTEQPGVWLFLIGSLLFAAKPTLRLLHGLQDRAWRRRMERELTAEAHDLLQAFHPKPRFPRM